MPSSSCISCTLLLNVDHSWLKRVEASMGRARKYSVVANGADADERVDGDGCEVDELEFETNLELRGPGPLPPGEV